jgi:hypothetical protein
MAVSAPGLAGVARQRLAAGHRSDSMAMPRDPDTPPPGSAAPRSSDVMARLTLSALERTKAEPDLWRLPEVHRALLVSGLSVLVSSLERLKADLG